ncbi:nucleotidyltransferase domain-containing protein [Vibrio fluvialis]|nr:nucleotidyltransferase domain-containing protein [Vibrio fluvialis]MBY8209474.1 nucleotidyltransferase domain-containing protein [Vibrio fluvialis]
MQEKTQSGFHQSDGAAADTGLDEQGLIHNTCSPDKIQREFLPVVDALLDNLNHAFPGEIHSVYLYGSVARGVAEIGRSDQDISLIFNHQIQASQRERLREISCEFPRRFSQISKLDLDPGCLEEVLHPREKYRWQFWLKHCCCCISGDDVAKTFEALKPSRHIALELNHDLAAFLSFSSEHVAGREVKVQKQVLAKKILRTAYYLNAEHHGSWYTDLAACARVAKLYYPQQTEQIDTAYTLARGGDCSPAAFKVLTSQLGTMLVKQMATMTRYSAQMDEDMNDEEKGDVTNP